MTKLIYLSIHGEWEGGTGRKNGKEVFKEHLKPTHKQEESPEEA